MKRALTAEDVEPAVLGGAILGGGGGGSIEEGMRAASLAMDAGEPSMWSADEVRAEALTVTVALVGAPSSPDAFVRASHVLAALSRLRERVAGIETLNTNENGAETTVNGWLQSAITRLPVLDLACNGRAHPTGLMGSMGLHRLPDFNSVQAFAGGRGNVNGVAAGALEPVSNIVRRASIEAGGFVAVVRNPVTVSYTVANGAPGAISQAIAVGHSLIDGGVAAVARLLGGEICFEGIVRACALERRDGFDVGRVDFGERVALSVVNEFMTFEVAGKRLATFPDLIMTFDDSGRPVTSAAIRTGMKLRILTVPRQNLLLSPTMSMDELFRPVEDQLGEKII